MIRTLFFTLSVVLFLGLASPTSLSAQPFGVGDEVFPKEDFQLMSGREVLGGHDDIHVPLTIEQIQDGWLLVQAKFGKAWVLSDHVVAMDDAEEYWTKQLKSGATAQRHYYLGVLHHVAGNLKQAINDYSAAIRLDETYLVAYAERGRCRHQLSCEALAPDDRDYAVKAVADMDRALRLDQERHDYYTDLAWWLATSKVEAIRDGKRAVELATKACVLTDWQSLPELETLAAGYARAGEFDEAIHWQTRAIEIASQEEKPRCEELLAVYQDGKPWSESSPREIAVFLTERADSRFNKGELDKAMADYELAIAHDATYAAALAGRGWCRGKRGILLERWTIWTRRSDSIQTTPMHTTTVAGCGT